MKRRVYMLDSQLSRFGTHSDHGGIECGAEVVAGLLRRHPELRGRIDWMSAGAARMGRSEGRENGLSQSVALAAGLRPPPGLDVHAYSATGLAVAHQAITAIEAGRAEVAVVVGLDHMSTGSRGALIPEAAGLESDYGYSPSAFYALCAQRYMNETAISISMLAEITVRNRRYGATNPFARFQQQVSLEEVLASRLIAAPLTLLQCCANADGAGAALFLSADAASLYRTNMTAAAEVLGMAVVSAPEPEFVSLLSFEEDVRSSRAAYEEAAIDPRDVDVVELHDAFTISQVIHLEDLGLAERGSGWRVGSDASSLIVNPSGGLLSRGHPLGATGIAQLDGVRRALAHDGARIGLVQCAGGIQVVGQMMSSCVVLGKI